MAEDSIKKVIRKGLRRALVALAGGVALPLLAAPPVVGILQGNAVLVRQTTRWQLAEGAQLADRDGTGAQMGLGILHGGNFD